MTKQTMGPAITVQNYVAAFNRVDEDGMAECFANPGFILDGMAPHVWSGPAAARDWWWDAAAESEHLGVSDFCMRLGEPLHENASGEAAYFVAPATLSFKVKGQTVTQSGAIFTVALKRIENRWRITAWAWSKGTGGGIGDVAVPAA